MKKEKVKVSQLSHVWLFATPWTVACWIPLSMEFSRQEYLSRFPFPSPGDLPKSGVEPRSPALQAESLPFELPGKPQVKVVSDSATPCTVAFQALLSMEFSSQEYSSGYLFPYPGYLPKPGIKPRSPTLQVPSEVPRKPTLSWYKWNSYALLFKWKTSRCLTYPCG